MFVCVCVCDRESMYACKNLYVCVSIPIWRLGGNVPAWHDGRVEAIRHRGHLASGSRAEAKAKANWQMLILVGVCVAGWADGLKMDVCTRECMPI